eukprot:9498404-Pyramimonas_sp.AAC.1
MVAAKVTELMNSHKFLSRLMSESKLNECKKEVGGGELRADIDQQGRACTHCLNIVRVCVCVCVCA